MSDYVATQSSGVFINSIKIGTVSLGQGYQSQELNILNFNASLGESLIDGTIKTTQHKDYGSSNNVQVQNTSVKLWKRIN